MLDQTVNFEVEDGKVTASLSAGSFEQFTSEQFTQLMYLALDSNTVINPFAFAILEAEENSDDHLLIITDKKDISELSQEGLSTWITQLKAAVIQGATIIKQL